MTYEEAKRAVFRSGFVRRESWPLNRILKKDRFWCDKRGREASQINDHEMVGEGSSMFGLYKPTPEDEAATDWEWASCFDVWIREKLRDRG